jgi:two-component system, chemotaxis family, sensor kinase CheA
MLNRSAQLKPLFEAEFRERIGFVGEGLELLSEAGGASDQTLLASLLDTVQSEVRLLAVAARAAGLSWIEEIAGYFEKQLLAFDPAQSANSLERLHKAFATLAHPPERDRRKKTRPREAAGTQAGTQTGGQAETQTGGQAETGAAPTAASAPTPPAASAVQTVTVPAIQVPAMPAIPAAAPAGAGSLRVPVVKLDRLMAHSGELTVAHLRLAEHAETWQGLRRHLADDTISLQEMRRLLAKVGQAASEAVGAVTADGSRGPAASRWLELEALEGHLVKLEERLSERLRRSGQVYEQLKNDLSDLGRETQALEDEVIGLRLVPVESIIGPLERLCRDVARETGKAARFVLKGGQIEIDRRVLDELRTAFQHLLRNAIDHGIEAPAVRQAAGKPAEGRLELRVERNDGVVFYFGDDGAGLDGARIRAVALERGLLTATEAQQLSDEATFDLIFRPGFSTRNVTTQLSGRGVGMDIVREQVRALGGSVSVTSSPGQGSRFRLRVPLSLTTVQVLVVEASPVHGLANGVASGVASNGERRSAPAGRFCLPVASVELVGQVSAQEVKQLEGRKVVFVGGQALPLVSLASLVDETEVASERAAFFVLSAGGQQGLRVAFTVSRLVEVREVVVKTLAWPLSRVPTLMGATVLGAGHLALILEPRELVERALGQAISHQVQLRPPPRRPVVLVTDDSLTTRALQRSLLESAGYDTRVAVDGQNALEVLRAEEIDLLVSDVEMPRLDGYGLCSEIRRDERLRHIPVILVTSLDSDEHRARGAEAGADAYIVKGRFEAGVLLETVGRLL